VRQDPVLAQVKLIAEPWDIGPGGYQVGNFPSGWVEWNDQYRDTMRALLAERGSATRRFARRFAGSSDLFQKTTRLPTASVNFITAHDGFTLRDLVSYNDKHNEANGEGNRDGHHANQSWNCGVEGGTDNQEVLHLRARLQRALLATLFFSQGTPMLLAGDEIGHSQIGNNNAYCQDNELCWLDWRHADHALFELTSDLIALRRRYPALRHTGWYEGAARAGGHPDIEWRAPDGLPLIEASWSSPARSASASVPTRPGKPACCCSMRWRSRWISPCPRAVASGIRQRRRRRAPERNERQHGGAGARRRAAGGGLNRSEHIERT
jgi:glycogen debranching enzyme GlgX